jgi:trimeric autotransporter adhesin
VIRTSIPDRQSLPLGRPLLRAVLWCMSFLLAATPAGAVPCTNWLAQSLTAPPPGTDGLVYAMTTWDPDGGGPLAPQLIIGGFFTSVEGVSAHNIAAWDGLVWRPLGAGTDSSVTALTVYNGQLIAGGRFTSAGGFPAARIAKWTGSAWLPLVDGIGGIATASVHTLGVWNGELIAGGEFTVPARNIARWNGSIWQRLDSGVDGPVYCLFTGATDLYVGGAMYEAGGVPTRWLAIWNGTNWEEGPNYWHYLAPQSPIVSMAFYDGALCVATQGGVRRLDGSNWSTMMGSSPSYAYVSALLVYGGQLIAAGPFDSPALRVAAWNGSAWGQVGVGLGTAGYDYSGRQTVWALAEYNGLLFAGGGFTQHGDGSLAPGISRWDHVAWKVPDIPERVSALATFGSKVGVGGYFSQPTPAGQAYEVMSWDGQQFTRLGTGLDAPAAALLGYSTGSPLPDHHLVAGGTFTLAGGIAVNHIARWTESQNVPFESWSAMGSGFNNAVLTLESYRGDVIAGGSFSSSGATATSRVARWNGSTWQPMGLGTNAVVRALKSFFVPLGKNNIIVAGGDFTTANGTSASRIAYWTESSLNGTVTPWQPMGSGFNGSVYAIERFNNATFAAGAFTASGATPVNRIAKYTAAGWEQVGATAGGGFNGLVYALRVENGELYAAGSFTMADGVPALNVARWNGASWSDAGGGTIGPVYALVPFHGEVLAGGEISQAGAAATIGAARFLPTGVPWIYSQSGSQSVGVGQSAMFQVTPASGYDDLTYTWRRNAIPLGDGMTAHGSVIAGAQSPALVLQNVSEPDSGLYDCVVAHSCGAATSVASPLTVMSLTGVAAGGLAGDLQLAARPIPVRATAQVEFQLPQSGIVALVVYDVGGRSVRRLVESFLPAGPHRLTWDGRDDEGRAVAPGVYLLRLSAAGRRIQQHVPLLR